MVLRAEKRVIDWLDKHKLGLFVAAISVIALLMRFWARDYESGDYIIFLKDWFTACKEQGGLRGLNQPVGNYNIMYQFIITLLTYLPFPPLYMYKAVSVVFDFLLAITAAFLVCDLKGKRGVYFALTYAAVLLLPTCFVNSAVWGQCDSIYVTFSLLCVLFLFREKFVTAFIFLGFAFGMKLQAVFIFPFVAYVYFTRRKFSILYAIIPLAINIVPNLLCGRSALDTFRMYFGQATQYRLMQLSFPSFWNFFAEAYWPLGIMALLFTFGLLGTALLCLMYRKDLFENRENMFYILVWSAWTCLVFLPAMHDRYGYIVEILMLIAAIYNLRLIPFAVLVEISGMLAVCGFLWGDQVYFDQRIEVATLIFVAGYVAFTCLLLWKFKKHTMEVPKTT